MDKPEEPSLQSEGKATERLLAGPAKALLEELRCELPRKIVDMPQTGLDNVLDILDNHSMLHAARERLQVVSKDKTIDVLFCMHVASMIATLNLFLNPELRYTWKNVSLVTSKAQGHGISHTQRIREWVLTYLQLRKLPLHRLGQTKWTALEDKDITQEIKLQLTENIKGKYLKASNVVDVVASLEIQAIMKQKGFVKPSILERTARRWLTGLGWQYGNLKTRMYIDGHEREDVVEYRRQFVACWKENEQQLRWK